MMQNLLLIFLALLCTCYSITTTEREEKSLSPFIWVRNATGDENIPLNSTYGSVSIQGVIAQVKITQVYQNKGTKAIEASYVFPASTNAVLYGMQMFVEGRLVVGKIYPKHEAKMIYDEAKQQGKTATLLEMERPNVYAMSVANILPGDFIRVEMFYTELLVPTDNVYMFHYPAVVGPRYTGEGGKSLPVSSFSGNVSFGFEMSIHAGMTVSEIYSRTHQFDITKLDDSNYDLALSSNNVDPGLKDVQVSFILSGKQIQTGLIAYHGLLDDGVGGPFRLIDGSEITWDLDPHEEMENFFLAMIQPPILENVGEPSTREYIFLLDTSGSMSGYPEKLSHHIMTLLIQSLRPERDYFNVLAFAGGNTVFSEKSVLASLASMNNAIKFVSNFAAGGGTQMLDAIKRGLNIPKLDDARGVARTYVILTDGFVSVEYEIFELIRDNLGSANFFGFSIGESPNRFLTKGIAQVGRGSEFWVVNETEGDELTQKFLRLANFPLLTDVKVTFSSEWDIYDINPVPGILLAQRPIIINGKWRGEMPDGLLINATGKTTNGSTWTGEIMSDITIKTYPPKHSRSLRYIWAGTVVSDIGYSTSNQTKQNTSITPIGLKYNILTEYTSFLAVDTEIRNTITNNDVLNIAENLPLPESLKPFNESSSNEDSIDSHETVYESYPIYLNSGSSSILPSSFVLLLLIAIMIV